MSRFSQVSTSLFIVDAVTSLGYHKECVTDMQFCFLASICFICTLDIQLLKKLLGTMYCLSKHPSVCLQTALADFFFFSERGHKFWCMLVSQNWESSFRFELKIAVCIVIVMWFFWRSKDLEFKRWRKRRGQLIFDACSGWRCYSSLSLFCFQGLVYFFWFWGDICYYFRRRPFCTFDWLKTLYSLGTYYPLEPFLHRIAILSKTLLLSL